MFNKVCLQFNVFLSNEELRKLAMMSQSEDQSFDLSAISNAAGFLNEINYSRLSQALGLHKPSLDRIQTSQLNFSQAKAVQNIISKMRGGKQSVTNLHDIRTSVNSSKIF